MTHSAIKGIKISGACIFGIYIAALIYCLFFAEEYGRMGMVAYRCNFIPFREIKRYILYWDIVGLRYVFLNLAGNIIGFMPFGMLIPVFARSSRSLWKIMLLCIEVSAVVEVTQLIFRVGSCDIDDIILNTVGGILGYLIFRIFAAAYKRG